MFVLRTSLHISNDFGVVVVISLHGRMYFNTDDPRSCNQNMAGRQKNITTRTWTLANLALFGLENMDPGIAVMAIY